MELRREIGLDIVGEVEPQCDRIGERKALAQSRYETLAIEIARLNMGAPAA